MDPNEIIFSCGHAERVEISCEKKDLAYLRDRISRRPCPNCRHQAVNGKATKQAVRSGLPSLEGSSKQVPWATTIRNEADASVRQWFLELQQRANVGEALGRASAEEIASARHFIQSITGDWQAALTGRTQSAFWINHRGASAQQWLQAIASQAYRARQAKERVASKA